MNMKGLKNPSKERELVRGEVLRLECERWVEKGWCGRTAERNWKGRTVWRVKIKWGGGFASKHTHQFGFGPRIRG